MNHSFAQTKDKVMSQNPLWLHVRLLDWMGVQTLYLTSDWLRTQGEEVSHGGG